MPSPLVQAELAILQRDMQLCVVTRYRKVANQLARLRDAGVPDDCVLMHGGASAMLKPLFIVLRDDSRKALVIIVRGTSSIRDVFTSLSVTSKPHHVLGESGMVVGWSHFGMLAGARWIYGKARPVVHEFMRDHPDWHVRLVGHSLGGGTAAMLTMMCAPPSA